MKKGAAVVLLSGGIDSAACAYMLLRQGYDVSAVHISYGQAAEAIEFRHARKVASYLEIEIERVRLIGRKPFSTGEITGRNAFFIMGTLFFGRVSNGLIATGIHAGTGYYDCSEAFLSLTQRFLAEHTDGQVALHSPFSHWTKPDVYEYFTKTKIPLGLTYSCESGEADACGICQSCKDRKHFDAR